MGRLQPTWILILAVTDCLLPARLAWCQAGQVRQARDRAVYPGWGPEWRDHGCKMPYSCRARVAWDGPGPDRPGLWVKDGKGLPLPRQSKVNGLFDLGLPEVRYLDVWVGYIDSIALALLVLCVDGDLREDRGLRRHGQAKLRNWIAFTAHNGHVLECNSSTYAAVPIQAWPNSETRSSAWIPSAWIQCCWRRSCSAAWGPASPCIYPRRQ